MQHYKIKEYADITILGAKYLEAGTPNLEIEAVRDTIAQIMTEDFIKGLKVLGYKVNSPEKCIAIKLDKNCQLSVTFGQLNSGFYRGFSFQKVVAYFLVDNAEEDMTDEYTCNKANCKNLLRYMNECHKLGVDLSKYSNQVSKLVKEHLLKYENGDWTILEEMLGHSFFAFLRVFFSFITYIGYLANNRDQVDIVDLRESENVDEKEVLKVIANDLKMNKKSTIYQRMFDNASKGEDESIKDTFFGAVKVVLEDAGHEDPEIKESLEKAIIKKFRKQIIKMMNKMFIEAFYMLNEEIPFDCSVYIDMDMGEIKGYEGEMEYCLDVADDTNEKRLEILMKAITLIPR